MSLYQLHRCVWDHMRAGEIGSEGAKEFDPARYDLTEEERTAFENRDPAALYQLGLHPVLLNGFLRAAGFARDEYRKILQPLATPPGRTARWQK